MTILISPDKFKGSLTAPEVCQSVARGIRRFDPSIEVLAHPLADGGEGTLTVLEQVIPAERVYTAVHDPLFRPVEAYYLKDGDTAYIEMAVASGLQLLKAEERNCLYTTSYGTGELILDAIGKGVTRVFLFVGGSATCDGGIGMAAALGYRFLSDKDEGELSTIGKNLERVDSIDAKHLNFDPEKVEVTVVCDVKNTLYGKEGAAYVYAPQKGADEEAVERLDLGLRQLSQVIFQKTGQDVSTLPGGGAAGGIAAGAVAFLNARIQPGIDTIMDISGFRNKLQGVDLVITGEGKVDLQTEQGKVVKGVADLCRELGIPVGLICGTLEADEQALQKWGIRYWRQILEEGVSMREAIEEAGERVEELAFDLMKEAG